MSSPPKQT